MITNHGYLDNPTFRGMRQSLMQTFDEIYILDLHGNSLKKETCPDGEPRQERLRYPAGRGHRLLHQARRQDRRPMPWSSHADSGVQRESKYDWLACPRPERYRLDRNSSPDLRSHLFVPRDDALEASLSALSVRPRCLSREQRGIVTARDASHHSLVAGRSLENGDRFLADGPGTGARRLQL